MNYGLSGIIQFLQAGSYFVFITEVKDKKNEYLK